MHSYGEAPINKLHRPSTLTRLSAHHKPRTGKHSSICDDFTIKQKERTRATTSYHSAFSEVPSQSDNESQRYEVRRHPSRLAQHGSAFFLRCLLNYLTIITQIAFNDMGNSKQSASYCVFPASTTGSSQPIAANSGSHRVYLRRIFHRRFQALHPSAAHRRNLQPSHPRTSDVPSAMEGGSRPPQHLDLVHLGSAFAGKWSFEIRGPYPTHAHLTKGAECRPTVSLR